jgi:hypothetical protein
MNGIRDMVENPHLIYKRNANYWAFLLQSYEGGRNYCNADLPGANANLGLLDRLFKVFVEGKEVLPNVVTGNLFMHPKERAEDYQQRVRMSYYYNFCAPVIDIYTNHLFKDAIREDFGSIEKTIEQINQNVDNQDSSIEEFRRQVAEASQIYGHCFVLIDSPNISSTEIISREDQIKRRAFPYATIYCPLAVINWSLDKFGSPHWILLREDIETNSDFNNFDAKKQGDFVYKLWTRNEWYVYDREFKLISNGLHGIGRVPIVCVYSKRSKMYQAFLGVSDLADISFLARDIYNSCSELRQILRDQTFAFLAVQGSSDEYNELTIGVSKAILYPENRNAPQYVSPPSDNAATYFNHIDRQVRKIFQLAKLEGGSAQQDQEVTPQSGVSKAWDFNETNSSLANKAANMEDGEYKIWDVFSAWEGKEFDGSIQYPREFSVQSLNDDLDEAAKEFKLQLGETFDLEVKKAIQKKKFPRATDEELEKMATEAEAKGNPNNNGNGNVNTGGLSIRDRMPFLFKSKTPNSAENGG